MEALRGMLLAGQIADAAELCSDLWAELEAELRGDTPEPEEEPVLLAAPVTLDMTANTTAVSFAGVNPTTGRRVL